MNIKIINLVVLVEVEDGNVHQLVISDKYKKTIIDLLLIENPKGLKMLDRIEPLKFNENEEL